VAQRVRRGIALLFHDRGSRRGEWSPARPGRTLPPGMTRTHFTGAWVCGHIGLENLKERDNLEDVVLDGRIIFK